MRNGFSRQVGRSAHHFDRPITMGVVGLVIAFVGTATFGTAVASATPAPPPERVGAAPVAPNGTTVVGPLAATTVLRIGVVLQPRDPAALARFATEVSTPGSPLYRHYLAPGQFPAVFGPTTSTISAVEGVLKADGLHPGPISSNHLSIPVTATAGQLSSAFSIGFARYKKPNGPVAFANTAAPQFPGSVAPAIQSVIGLDDLHLPHPAGVVTAPPRPVPVRSPQVVTGGPQPCSSATTAAEDYGSYTADQLASAYGFPSLYGAGNEGAGQTVALYELAPNSTSDISAYQSCYGTSASVTYTQVDGGSGSSGTGEGIEPTLDIEGLIGLAPRANIDVYQGPNSGTGPYDTYNAIVTADTAKVISTSWGFCEYPGDASYVEAENTVFQQAASQGQSVFSAAGDTGSEACYQSTGSTGLAVQDPASQPFVTGVGGTTLSALGPPPSETVWNDASTNGGAGGGGISTNWPMPSYQANAPSSLNVINANSSGAPCGATSGSYCREVPDVSANADPSTGYVIYYSGTDTGTSGWQGGIGGTSAAAPLWAAVMALVNADSACSAPVGFASPALYAIAGNSTSYPSAFQDITIGNNDYTGTNNGLYPAGTGYDMASGLGTPDASGLASLLCSSTSSSGWTVSLAASNSTPAGGSPVTLTATANQDVGPTPYYIVIETSAGQVLANCGSGTTCSATVTNPGGTTASYVAKVSGSDGASPVQATSSTVTVTWGGASSSGWTVSLAASNTSPSGGSSVTLSATANQDVGPTPYYIVIETSTGQVLANCGSGTTCSATVTNPGGTTASYVAKVSGSDGASPVEATSSTVTVAWGGASSSGWTVSLAASNTSPSGGSPVTLSATANQDVGLVSRHAG